MPSATSLYLLGMIVLYKAYGGEVIVILFDGDRYD